jgi:hypothetical protein
VLTVLVVVLAAQNGKAFADCRAHHKGVGRALAVLVRLSQRELLEVCGGRRHKRVFSGEKREYEPSLS